MSRTVVRRWTSIVLAGLVASTTLALAATPARATGQTWWVATTGTAASPSSSGSSCANPSFVGTSHATIQTAIDAAAAGDEVKICAGTYSIDTTITLGKALTITGAGSSLPTLDGGGATRILDITTGGFTVSINSLHFRNGRATGTNPYGAGIRSHPNVTLNVNDSFFVNNHADNHGGGIALIGGSSNSGSVQVARSTFYKNRAEDGGGIVVVGITANASNVSNSTFVQNSATRNGGAINGSFSVMRASNSTFVDNLAPQGGDTSWVVTMKGNLIAYSSSVTPTTDVCNLSGSTPVNNVSTTTSCLANGETAVTVDSLALGFLAPWGGTVPTISIGAGSTAINAVTGANCSANDQRGVSRSGANCDAGAFEFVAGSGSLTASTTTLTLVQGRAITNAPTFTKSGLTEPVSLRLATELNGSIPGGVAFSTSTGVLSGTPASTYPNRSLIVTATDANGLVTSAKITIENCVLSLNNGSYQITNALDLDLFRLEACGMDSDYLQTSDITWNTTWTPPSSLDENFTGTYDGGGHSITGLQISGGQTAFIPWTLGATIRNLNLDVTVSGAYSTSGLVRLADATTIDNVRVSGSIIITGDHGCHAGLAGETTNGTTITNSSFEGTIDSPDSSWIGGLVGCTYQGSVIETSFFEGTISGKSDVGGLVGWMDQTEIRNSYAVGSVTGSDDNLGGLAGWVGGDGTDADTVAVENSYSSMAIQGVTDEGALIGEGPPTAISSTFWEDGLTGVSGLPPIGRLDPAGTQPSISPTSTASMKSFAFFDTAGWNIVNGWVDHTTTSDTWGICDGAGRPFLLWSEATDVCNPSQPPSSNPSQPPSSNPSQPTPDNGTSNPSQPTPDNGTSNPSQPTPTTPSTTGPAVATGQVTVLVDGQPTPSSIAWSGTSRISGRIGVIDMTLDFESGATSVSLPNTFEPGARITLSLGGLQPNSAATATLFSTPVSLGNFTADSAGALNTSFSLPMGAESGSHRIRLEMVGNDGRAITLWLGIDVSATTLTLPATGWSQQSMLMLAVTVMSFGAGAWIISGGRRRLRPVRSSRR